MRAVMWCTEALYAIEGMGQGPLGANWGDGFGTDPEAVTILQQSGLPQSDPNPFFQKLMVRRSLLAPRPGAVGLMPAGRESLPACHCALLASQCNVTRSPWAACSQRLPANLFLESHLEVN